jgi:hypothetical protein
MINAIFGVPLIKTKVDLKKIKFKYKKTSKAFLSGVENSHLHENIIDVSTDKYLCDIFHKNLTEMGLKNFNVNILNIWRNLYKKGDFQEKHIHVESQFSFIIYEDVYKSYTVFNRAETYLILSLKLNKIFSTEYRLNCVNGDMLIFPSFLEHMVLKTEEDCKTISGNILINI